MGKGEYPFLFTAVGVHWIAQIKVKMVKQRANGLNIAGGVTRETKRTAAADAGYMYCAAGADGDGVERP